MSDGPPTLIEEALPRFDFRSRHSRRVAAPARSVWRAIDHYAPGKDASLPVRTLFLVRGIRLPGGRLRESLGPLGFTVLAERPEREIVAGTFGRFWALRELDNTANPNDLDGFRAFERPGWAKGALSIRVEPFANGSTNLVTETRVWCADDGARRRFAAYWAFIRIFSGWIRREMLSRIARNAEEDR